MPEAPDEAEFRARCRAFLEEHAVGIHLGGDTDAGGARRLEAGRKFQQALFDARSRRVELLRSFHLAGARLDRLTGRHASLLSNAENR